MILLKKYLVEIAAVLIAAALTIQTSFMAYYVSNIHQNGVMLAKIEQKIDSHIFYHDKLKNCGDDSSRDIHTPSGIIIHKNL